MVNKVNKVLLGNQEHHPEFQKPLRGNGQHTERGSKKQRKRDRKRTTQEDNGKEKDGKGQRIMKRKRMEKDTRKEKGNNEHQMHGAEAEMFFFSPIWGTRKGQQVTLKTVTNSIQLKTNSERG